MDTSMLNPITAKKKKMFRRIEIQILNSKRNIFFIHDLNISDGLGFLPWFRASAGAYNTTAM